MRTTIRQSVGKVVAALIIAATFAIALKPAPAHAFFWSAIGAGLNLASGAVAANPNPEAREAAPAEHRSLAESVFGLGEATGARTVTEAVRDPKLVRAVEAQVAR